MHETQKSGELPEQTMSDLSAHFKISDRTKTETTVKCPPLVFTAVSSF